MKFGMKNIAGLSIIAAIVSLSACERKGAMTSTDPQAATEKVFKIGEFGSMTGSEATFGISTHNGIKMVIDDVNKAGGVKGHRLELITLDNQGKPEEAVTAVTRLITQDKVSVVLGEVASSRSLAGAPVAQRFQIPMISPSSTNPKVTEVGDYIFRVCFTDPFQGRVIAKFAVDNLKAKTAAILIDRKSDYSVGLAEFFESTFKELGGTIVEKQYYVAGDMDFKGQLTNIRSKKPDVVVLPGYYTEAGLIFKQAREMGINQAFLGGDGWDSPKLKEIASDAMNGNYFSNHYSAEDQDPKVQNFITRYQELYGVIPDGLAAMGHDAALVLVDAMNRAPDLGPKAIRDALASTKDFPGVTGVITIDEKRNASKPAVMLKIEGGEFKFVKRVEP